VRLQSYPPLIATALSLLLCGLTSAPTFAQGVGMTAPDFKSTKPAPRTGDGHPDLSGYWRHARNPSGKEITMLTLYLDW